jgi:gliding motility-associated-like protein
VEIDVKSNLSANAGRDTAVLQGQPLRLKASGGVRYLWSPATGLNDPEAAEPRVDTDRDRTYFLKAISIEGCVGMDTVNIRVFRTDPDIFVPTAFTPNGDRLNDVLTPIPVGIVEFQFFRVYNRWGQLVYSTNETGKGWDGMFKGVPQRSGTFAWHVRGLAIDGRAVEKRGTATIIR